MGKRVGSLVLLLSGLAAAQSAPDAGAPIFPLDAGRYAARGRDVSAFFTGEGIALALAQTSLPPHRGVPPSVRAWGLHWSVAGASRVEPRPQDPRADRVHVLVGPRSTWRADLAAYGAVRYPEVRPGMDLRVESRRQAVKYSLEARAGVDVSRVRLRYAGAESIALVDGGLEIRTGLGTLREDGLDCWQPSGPLRLPLQAWYGGVYPTVDPLVWEYEIVVGGVDPALPVVIDPTITWSTYLGGTGTEHQGDLSGAPGIDADGHILVTGMTYSLDFPTVGAYDSTNAGYSDVFVCKFQPDGQALVWSTYLGGSGMELAGGLAVDPSGDVFVTGSTYSRDLPATGPDATLGGWDDVFVARLTSDGSNLAWCTYLGGAYDEYAGGVALAAEGDVYVTGTTGSVNFPAGAGFSMSSYDYYYNAFVTRLRGDGSAIVWSGFLGGSDWEWAYSIAPHPDGVVVAGETYSPDFPAAGGAGTAYAGDADAFVALVRADGSALAWSTLLGGTGTDQPFAVATGDAGHVYVAGSTTSAGFPIVGGFDSKLGGLSDAFVAKLDPSAGAIVWSSFLGGSSFEWAYGIAVEPVAGQEYVHVAGTTFSADFPLLRAIDTKQAASEGFVTTIRPDGSSLYQSTFLGGSSHDYARGIATGVDGTWITGTTSSGDFSTAAAFDPSYGGDGDFFVVGLDGLTPRPPTPAELVQCDSPGEEARPAGFVDFDQTMSFRVHARGLETGQRVTLEVEVKPVGVPFDGTNVAVGFEVADWYWSDVTVGPLEWGGYHWRARWVDADGIPSRWAEFEPAAETDFEISMGRDNPNGGTCSASAAGGRPGPALWLVALLIALAARYCRPLFFAGPQSGRNCACGK